LDGLELSASEDEKTPRKKRKSDKGGKDDEADEADDKKDVSKKLIQKWKSSMEASSSLRATREVVLAFRSAAHLDDEKKEKYKYSISDSNG
jgi:nucleolar complex protein 2